MTVRATLPLLAALASAALIAIPTDGPAQAQGGAFAGNDPTVAAALTDELIQITSRFAGAQIDVFGVVNGLRDDDDLVVVVRGPPQPVTIMRKRRWLGVWVNGQPARFEGPPAYYATASTRPIAEIASAAELSRHDVGIENAPLRVVGADAERAAASIGEYRDALVRIKERERLYRNVPNGVHVYDGGLFRARIELPPGSPVGAYRADVFLFRDGTSAARRSTELQVVKVGLERFIYGAAHQRPLLYGFSAVAFAFAAGWLGAAAFRRR